MSALLVDYRLAPERRSPPLSKMHAPRTDGF